MKKISMISITIDATTFDLFAYYNVKMDNFKFFRNGERPYILWSANDHETPDTWRTSCVFEFMVLLPIPFGYAQRTTEGPMNTRFGLL